MTLPVNEVVLLFSALFALYSPVAALSSYLPVVTAFSHREHLRLALGLFVNVLVFSLVALWVGEPLLHLLGLSTDALAVTGGIALLYAGVPMMRGLDDPPAEQVAAGPGENARSASTPSWRDVVFMPLTFPLTVGGTTFGLFVTFRALAKNTADVVGLSIAGLAYALLTGVTLYLAGHLDRRVSPQTRVVLNRIAGLLLVAIAVSIFSGSGTRLVVSAFDALEHR